MRKIFFIIIFLLLVSSFLYSQTQYVTTIHPFKQILKEIVGDRVEVHQILPPGASPHTYELRPSDIKRIETATALIIGGENLDEWAKKLQNPNRIELIELLPKDYLLHININGNHTEKDEVSDHQHHHNSGVDPHFWTDPMAVKVLVPILAQKLGEIDNEQKAVYHTNAAQFASDLDSLYSKINQEIEGVQKKPVMLQTILPYYLM